jgi:anti-anti-sigma factor
MHEGRVLYADHDHVHVLRYVGDVRHPLAPSVSGFIDTLLERMATDDLVVDLSEADAIDSTNLGEIARIADLLNARGGKRAAIISPRPEISQVLFSMAFDEVFDICTESVGSKGGEPIPTVPASKDVSLRVILSAHRRLMQMSESNRKQFSEVVELMERELGPSDRP